MCGIAGMFSLVGEGAPYSVGVALRELTVGSTVRGYDSTGLLYYKSVPKEDNKLWFVKDAVVGPLLLPTRKEWSDHIEKARFACVHTRSATIGDINQANAHPFVCENVVGMHNGTVRGWKYNLADKFKDAEMDSHAIMEALSHTAPEQEEVVKLLLDLNYGAYTLVWFDKRIGKLRFARNKERPLWFATTATTVWFASEQRLLEWVLDRNNLTISKMWELKDHVLLDMDVLTGEVAYIDYEDRLPKYQAYVLGSYQPDYRGQSHWSYWEGQYGEDFGGWGSHAEWRMHGYKDKEDVEDAVVVVVVPKREFNGPIDMTTMQYWDFYERSPMPYTNLPVNVCTNLYSGARTLAGLPIWNGGPKDVKLKDILSEKIMATVPHAIYDTTLQSALAPVHIVDVDVAGNMHGYIEWGEELKAVAMSMQAKDLVQAVRTVLDLGCEAIIPDVAITGIRMYHHGEMALRAGKVYSDPGDVIVGEPLGSGTKDEYSAASAFGWAHPENLSRMAGVDWAAGWSK